MMFSSAYTGIFCFVNMEVSLKGNLDAKRVGNTPEELNMSTVELASAFTDPEHVGRTVVEMTRG
jgi:hypothetical protein